MRYKISKLQPFGVMIKPLSKSAHISDLNIEELRDLFKREQLVLLRGFNSFKNSEDFSNYCGRFGQVSQWPFGKVLELKEQDKAEDHIFDNSYVPMHWDGMYRPQVPEYQIFHCVKAPLQGEGGRTTFSNTTLVLKNTSPELRELWNRATGIYQRQMEFYNSKTISPLITKHPLRNFPVLRYNEPASSVHRRFLNPPVIDFIGIQHEEIDLLHRSLKEALYNSNNFYAHEWQDSDLIIADNFTLLHGREAFVSKSPRHLQRVQVLSDPPLDNPGLESYQ